MSVNAIITVRYNSTRLYGKVLLNIGDKPILQEIVDRLKLSKVDDVIVSTSEQSELIIEYCIQHDIPCFYYSDEEDCLTRLYLTTFQYPSDIVVRIWGDCPRIKPDIVNMGIDILYQNSLDYLYMRLIRGLDAAIFRAKSFQKLYCDMSPNDKKYWNEVNEHSCWLDREYATMIVKDKSEVNLSVDTLEDYERIKCLK